MSACVLACVQQSELVLFCGHMRERVQSRWSDALLCLNAYDICFVCSGRGGRCGGRKAGTVVLGLNTCLKSELEPTSWQGSRTSAAGSEFFNSHYIRWLDFDIQCLKIDGVLRSCSVPPYPSSPSPGRLAVEPQPCTDRVTCVTDTGYPRVGE